MSVTDELRVRGGRHVCPVRRCSVMVADKLLMCGTHWRMVDAPLRSAVWAAYRDGKGVGSGELYAAQAAAIECVNGQLADA